MLSNCTDSYGSNHKRFITSYFPNVRSSSSQSFKSNLSSSNAACTELIELQEQNDIDSDLRDKLSTIGMRIRKNVIEGYKLGDDYLTNDTGYQSIYYGSTSLPVFEGYRDKLFGQDMMTAEDGGFGGIVPAFKSSSMTSTMATNYGDYDSENDTVRGTIFMGTSQRKRNRGHPLDDEAELTENDDDHASDAKTHYVPSRSFSASAAKDNDNDFPDATFLMPKEMIM
ncbi:hypothetical protein NADFUDRAFT_82417 [Nadsonia fulvescens var. elongata DSM 6958]|uniref:Damage-regulated import facilitator 1 n=1 Tax=Nadsonia fulvescens var. elongata DSM 6958 TaxID=857566 RepID=A0A1E3PMI8_9ASCO|nr:hypothetical protein NADFUDRAFT_82417 [Nadsonia fulvescens var. elongata DSM 6958]